MLRSMYAGISGMKNFQTKLDVIGNNIANVNTVGFKKGRVTFQDMMSQMTSGAQGPTATRGGVNPMQVGLGSQLGTIDNIHTQGFRQTTNNPLDFAIEGDGMFVLRDGGSTAYTRAGNFYLDNQGNVVNPQGLYLTGFEGYRDLNSPHFFALDSVGNDVTISKDSLTQTLTVTYTSKAGEEIVETRAPKEGGGYDPVTISHKDGMETTITFDGDGSPTIETSESGTPVTKSITQVDGVTTIDYNNGSTTLTIDVNGVIRLGSNVDSGEAFTNDETGVLTAEDEDGNTVTIDGNRLQVIDSNGVSLLDTTIVLTSFQDKVDYTQTSTLNIPDTAKSFSVQTNGTVTYIDEFGQTRIAGQVALANFSNPAGLEKAGSNLFYDSQNAGFNGLVIPGTSGAGSIVSGALEMSNVDLAEEFTEMITAQRGFQANTRIITTSDEILQELVNLKR